MKRLAYTVEEGEQGFVIRTKWMLATWERCLSVLGIALAAWIFFRAFHVPSRLGYGLATSGAIVQIFRCVRTFQTCTAITKFEANLAGDFPHGYRPVSFVPLANIVYLTYRDEEARGESEILPAGLWAELERGSTCLVPNVSRAEADALALRIEDRFRNVIGCGIAPGRSSGSITTLGLHT